MRVGRDEPLDADELPLEAEAFLSWLLTERGRSANTLAAYRRDLSAYVHWLNDAVRPRRRAWHVNWPRCACSIASW